MAISGKTIMWTCGVALVCAAGWFWVTYEGHASVVKIAQQNNLCKTTECEEGAAIIYNGLVTKLSVSQSKIDWCLGVEEISQVKVRKGGWLKSMLIEAAYWPCDVFSSPAP